MSKTLWESWLLRKRVTILFRENRDRLQRSDVGEAASFFFFFIKKGKSVSNSQRHSCWPRKAGALLESYWCRMIGIMFIPLSRVKIVSV